MQYMKRNIWRKIKTRHKKQLSLSLDSKCVKCLGKHNGGEKLEHDINRDRY